MQLAKTSIEPKFVELTAVVLRFFFFKQRTAVLVGMRVLVYARGQV